MKMMDERTEEMLVAADPRHDAVELQIHGTSEEDAFSIRLTREEGRRLAALLLFQVARLDRPRHTWAAPHGAPAAKRVRGEGVMRGSPRTGEVFAA